MAQCWSAKEYACNGRFVADLAGDLLSWLQVQPGERVLDLGCGDGALTEVLQAKGARVTGIDLSPSMVEAARARGLEVQQGSGESLPFSEEFDVVFSNAALHWMLDQEAVLQGVYKSLRPGGRFVAELGGHGNIASIRTALRAAVAPLGMEAEEAGNNVFFTVAEYRDMLERQHFTVQRIELVPRPILLPTGIRAWVTTFRRSLLEALEEHQRTAVLDTVESLLRPILQDRTGSWYADYVRLRFVAGKFSRGADESTHMGALP